MPVSLSVATIVVLATVTALALRKLWSLHKEADQRDDVLWGAFVPQPVVAVVEYEPTPIPPQARGVRVYPIHPTPEA